MIHVFTVAVILDKFTEISSKYRRSALFFKALSCLFVLISHFKPLTKIRTNEEHTEVEAAKKLRTMKPPQNVLILI
mgnify:CR=1